MSSERQARLSQWQAIPSIKTPVWQKPLLNLATTSFGSWFYMNVAPIFDRVLLRTFGGKVSSSAGRPALVLHHVGAKTGIQRDTPLLCLPLPDKSLVIVASNAGKPTNPGWYFNVRKQPEVQVTYEGKIGKYIARELDAEESTILWPKLDAMFPGYIVYRKKAGERTVPLIILTPQSS
jgi:deazaflavin-dependent oxidoreductase (nitroreductase family)